MKRKHIKIIDLANKLEISESSMRNKLNGKYEFTRTEMFKIKEIFPEHSFEYLFKNDIEEEQKASNQ